MTGIMVRNSSSGRAEKTHGQTGTPEYHCWEAMIQRCTNPKHKQFTEYGGAGILVCERWKTFENFFLDMGRRPTPKHQIDRFPNQSGGYEPSNCRWATLKEQHRNKKSNRNLTFKGKTQCIMAWAEELGLTWDTIFKRLKNGWTIERTLSTPKLNYKNKGVRH